MEEEFEETSSEWLLSVLKEVQLDQFYVRIRDHLQISRISHFEYVTPEDLEKVKIYFSASSQVSGKSWPRAIKEA